MSEPDFAYDRSSDGYRKLTLGSAPRIRPADQRQRCGYYISPDGEASWGDHRVTYRGTTCEEVQCEVNHHPDVAPGCVEPVEDFQSRPGAGAIAATLYGWDGGGALFRDMGDYTATAAAHLVLDALRDAGYELVRRPGAGPKNF